MHTYRSALTLVGVSVPGHLVAEAEVPILTGPQAQGDLLIVPVDDVPDGLAWQRLPDGGVQVVRGEATGNTHWLHRGFDSAEIDWAGQARPAATGSPGAPGGLILGYLRVPAGQSALLIHTDEHGANGVGPGTYRINRKREGVPLSPAFRPDQPDRLVRD